MTRSRAASGPAVITDRSNPALSLPSRPTTQTARASASARSSASPKASTTAWESTLALPSSKRITATSSSMLVVRTEEVPDVTDMVGTLRRTAGTGQRGAEPHELPARDFACRRVDPRALRGLASARSPAPAAGAAAPIAGIGAAALRPACPTVTPVGRWGVGPRHAIVVQLTQRGSSVGIVTRFLTFAGNLRRGHHAGRESGKLFPNLGDPPTGDGVDFTIGSRASRRRPNGGSRRLPGALRPPPR